MLLELILNASHAILSCKIWPLLGMLDTYTYKVLLFKFRMFQSLGPFISGGSRGGEANSDAFTKKKHNQRAL